MLARRAVLPLPPQISGSRKLLFYTSDDRRNRLESTLLQVFILGDLKPFEINTYEKLGEGCQLWLTKCYKKVSHAAESLSPFSTFTLPFSVLSFHTLAHSFGVFCTFLHPRKTQPVSFQLLPHSLHKNTGVYGYSSHSGTLHASSASRSFCCRTFRPSDVSTFRRLGAACYTVPPMARQRLGQHFLADLHWREEIARAIRVSPHSLAPLAGDDQSLRTPLPRDDQHCWIEIGAGHGEITQHLVATGAPVHAIEIEPKFIAGLRRLAKQFPNLNVVPADVLETDIAAIASGRRIRVYGNLPYYITSPILHHLFTFAALIDEIHVVIQTEVAQRLAAEPGTSDYGYLSVVTQFYTRPEFVFEIPREAFNPPPEVTSALVTLRLPGERAKLSFASSAASNEGAQANSSRDAETRFLDFVKLCFSKKRKTLVNNLRTLAKPDRVREALAALSLRPDARAEQLSVSQLAALQVRLASP